jgi:CubicO group peptidase (beta-lactamase class C family)
MTHPTHTQNTQQRLFDPLDMRDTGFWVPPDKLSRLVVYFTSAAVPGMLVPVPFAYTHTDYSRVRACCSGVFVGVGVCACMALSVGA